MAKKLTDVILKSLRPEMQRYEVWDSSQKGFGVRVGPSGSRSFIWVYHYAGRPRRMTLGTYPQMSLATANKKLAQAKEDLSEGIDPGKQAVSQRAADRSAETVADLVTDYLERYARPRKRSASEDERILNKDVVPAWGHRKAKDITRRDVVALLNGIVDRGAPIQANRTFAAIRKMFNFAIAQAMIDLSPCDKIERPAAENQRDRVLSAEEIGTVWRALDSVGMEPNVRRIVRFMLATGQRKGEVLRLHIDEIDFERSLWALPASRTKNRRPHLVPLSRLALDIIAEAPATDRGFIFASPRSGGPYAAETLNHAVRRALRSKSGKPAPLGGMDHWTPHDLRRTFATRMRELGVSRLDVKALLNHTFSDVTAVYDRYDGLAEKRKALNTWNERLTQIINGEPLDSNVIPLAQSAGTSA